MDRISLLLGSIKCFPISFNTFRHFRWLPDGAGIWYHKLPINLKKKKFFKEQGAPWEEKGHKMHPLVSEGHGALLKMPRRNTTCSFGSDSIKI
jgi:hypothetical protein